MSFPFHIKSTNEINGVLGTINEDVQAIRVYPL